MVCMNPSLYRWQVGHGRGRFLGDSCESTFTIHKNYLSMIVVIEEG